VALTTAATVVAKGVAILAALVSVPLTLHYLGAERYGLWMMISSLAVMLRFADFGMGNGLLNVIARAHGEDDRARVVQAVSSGFFMLLAVAALVLTLGLAAYPFVPWPKVFNLKSTLAVRECGPALAVFVLCALVNMPLGTVQRVQSGYQEGFASNLWLAAGSVFSLCGVLVVIALRGGLPWLVLALAGGPVLSTLFNWLVQFRHTRPWLLPRLSAVDRRMVRTLAHAGGMFFAIQVVVALSAPADNIIIGQLLGPARVAEYAVPQKMLTLAYMLPAMWFGALWPAYGEAYARGDLAWVRRTLRRSLLFTLTLSAGTAGVLVAFGKPLMAVWVGSAVSVSSALLVPLAIYATINSVADTVGALLFGVSALKFFFLTILISTALGLALKIAFVTRFGLPGLAWGAVLSYGLAFALPNLLYALRLASGAVRSGSLTNAPILGVSPVETLNP
jgi:O-antigen/teichoic acid export membrane protein